MLDINIIRETPEIVRKAMQDRQMDPSPCRNPGSWMPAGARSWLKSRS